MDLGEDRNRRSDPVPALLGADRGERSNTLTDVGMVKPAEDVDLVDDSLEVAFEGLFPDHLDGDFDMATDLLRVCVMRIVGRRGPRCLFDPNVKGK